MTGQDNKHKQEEPSSVDEFDRDLEALVRESLESLLPMMIPEQAEVFRRTELLGESVETIAATLEISVETAESRLQAARAEIRTLLEISARSNLNRS